MDTLYANSLNGDKFTRVSGSQTDYAKAGMITPTEQRGDDPRELLAFFPFVGLATGVNMLIVAAYAQNGRA